MVDQPTDGAIFAGINLYLNGLRPRIWFEDVFVREHLTIRAVAVLASESEASDFATMAEYPGKAICCEACSLLQRDRTSIRCRAAWPNVFIVLAMRTKWEQILGGSRARMPQLANDGDQLSLSIV